MSRWVTIYEIAMIVILAAFIGAGALHFTYSHRKDALVAIRHAQQSAQAERDREALQKAETVIASLHALPGARRLTPEQAAALVTALSPFAGQKAEIWCASSGWDCADLAKDFQAVFMAAKWDTPELIIVGTPTGSDAFGIEIAVSPSWVPDINNMPPALDALGKTMTALGLLQKPTRLAAVKELKTGTIALRIGRVSPPR